MMQHLTFALLLAASPMTAQPVPPAPPAPPTPPAAPLPPLRPMPAPRLMFRYDYDYHYEMADRAAELQERAQERARDAQDRAMERAHEVQDRAAERAMERAQGALQRQTELQDRAMERAQEAQQRAMDRTMDHPLFAYGPMARMAPLPPIPPIPPVPPLPRISFGGQMPYYDHVLPEHAPAPWAQGDPADSLYRVAQQALSRGDYRKAAAGFKEIPQRFQYSAYAADAMYWEAHSLYRIGGTPELQEALAVLDALKQKYPTTRSRSQKDVSELSARIAGTLSSRGLGSNEAVKRALAETGANACDSEEQSVRAQALSALMETDPDAAAQLAQKMLSKKDECSVSLRRNAVMIAARRRDAQTITTLAGVAKADPSSEVRQTAVRYLAGMPGDDAFPALEDLLKTSDDQNVQREVVSSLARSSSPRARQAVRVIIERNDAQEGLRLSALRAYDRDRATTEDAKWLRGIYPKVDNPRVKSEIVQAITRIGGDDLDQWFLTLAKNEDEPIESRNAAVRRAAQTMDIPTLGKFYDQVAQRQLRETIVDALGNRREPEAIDKLIDIAKHGTDLQLRTQAISSLTRKHDPRANKALLELIDKP